MTLVARLVASIPLLLTLSSCGGDTPASPSRREIALPSLTPSSGATLTVRPCSPAEPDLLCADLQATFEVVVDEDLPDGTLAVDFMDGTARCGVAIVGPVALTSGRPTSIVLSTVAIGGSEGTYCQLPATTDRLVVTLTPSLSRIPAGVPVVTREFARTFTFTR